MTDTVQKLMSLADEYALWSSESQAEAARQALQDELTRLFTPLTEEQVATVYFGATGQSLCPQDNKLVHQFASAIAFQYGITGESK